MDTLNEKNLFEKVNKLSEKCHQLQFTILEENGQYIDFNIVFCVVYFAIIVLSFMHFYHMYNSAAFSKTW